jgi:SulP family sulfate permease
MTATMKWHDWMPGLTQFRSYERSWLRGDVLAGLTVAAYLVPQVMAYATLAGLSPVVGLWAAILPLALYAVFGSSRQLSVGPESTTALMTAAVLAPVAAGDPERYGILAAALAIAVGIICLAGGIARLGFLADLLSRPVLVGYITGIAVIMIASQLGKVTGTKVSGDDFVGQVRSFAADITALHWPTTALAASVLALLLALTRWAPRVPGPLIGVLAATVVVAVFSLDTNGIAVVGQIPFGLPAPGVPALSTDDLTTLLFPAVGIAIVAFSDNVLTAR